MSNEERLNALIMTIGLFINNDRLSNKRKVELIKEELDDYSSGEYDEILNCDLSNFDFGV